MKHLIIVGESGRGREVYATALLYSFLGGNSSMGEESVLHMHSTLSRKKSIGRRAKVGIGSVVIRHVPDDTHVFGNPAVKLRD